MITKLTFRYVTGLYFEHYPYSLWRRPNAGSASFATIHGVKLTAFSSLVTDLSATVSFSKVKASVLNGNQQPQVSKDYASEISRWRFRAGPQDPAYQRWQRPFCQTFVDACLLTRACMSLLWDTFCLCACASKSSPSKIDFWFDWRCHRCIFTADKFS